MKTYFSCLRISELHKFRLIFSTQQLSCVCWCQHCYHWLQSVKHEYVHCASLKYCSLYFKLSETNKNIDIHSFLFLNKRTALLIGTYILIFVIFWFCIFFISITWFIKTESVLLYIDLLKLVTHYSHNILSIEFSDVAVRVKITFVLIS